MIPCRQKRRVDDRTRRDHTENRNLGFLYQLPRLIDVYMHWSYHQNTSCGEAWEASGEDSDTEGSMKTHSIRVVDMYGMFQIFRPLTSQIELVLQKRQPWMFHIPPLTPALAQL